MGTVIEVVKGGLIVDIGLRGFLPASLVDIRRVGDLHPFVGQKLECKVIELDRNRNNVVLSRRAFLEETQAESRKELLDGLKKGEIRRGKVSSIVKFGAFVDLGGIDGLVHVSELSWKHVEDPAEVVEVGKEVDVEILDVDLERERISLSLKSTQEDPWEAFARRHAPGDVIDGKVTKLVSAHRRCPRPVAPAALTGTVPLDDPLLRSSASPLEEPTRNEVGVDDERSRVAATDTKVAFAAPEPALTADVA